MKLKVENPRIYRDSLIPSGKQKIGNWDKFILLMLLGYFYVRIALNVCYALLLTLLHNAYLFCTQNIHMVWGGLLICIRLVRLWPLYFSRICSSSQYAAFRCRRGVQWIRITSFCIVNLSLLIFLPQHLYVEYDCSRRSRSGMAHRRLRSCTNILPSWR